jgi:TonB family protein
VRIPGLFALTLVFSLPIRAAAVANLEDQLHKDYAGTEQLLRHSYGSDTLKFDSNGNPKNHEKQGPWTMLSGVIVDSLQLKPGRLELHGHRRLLVFNNQDKNLRSIKLDEKFWIEIETHQGPDQAAQLAAALANVFITPNNLVSVVPEYWQDYIARFTGKPAEGSPCQDSTVKEIESDSAAAGKVSEGIVEGIKIYDVSPTYSAIARSNRVQGDLALRAVIDETGTVSRVCITKALGAGIDDMMVETVRQWKYRPYTLNGQPIVVQTTIKASFGIR